VCTRIKPCPAVTVAKISCSLPVNKNSTLPRVLKMSLDGALLAGLPGNSSGTAAVITSVPVKCSRQPVPHAAGKRKFPSALLLIDLFTAGIAIRPVNHAGKNYSRQVAKAVNMYRLFYIVVVNGRDNTVFYSKGKEDICRSIKTPVSGERIKKGGNGNG